MKNHSQIENACAMVPHRRGEDHSGGKPEFVNSHDLYRSYSKMNFLKKNRRRRMSI